MYTIRVNDNGFVMEYKANNYAHAVTLFQAIQAKFSKVQVFNRDGELKLETV